MIYRYLWMCLIMYGLADGQGIGVHYDIALAASDIHIHRRIETIV